MADAGSKRLVDKWLARSCAVGLHVAAAHRAHAAVHTIRVIFFPRSPNRFRIVGDMS